MERTIRVTGKGKLSVKPDTIRLIMTMEGMKEEYDAALEESAEMTEHLKQMFSESGFDREDIKTLSFHVSTEYESYQESVANIPEIQAQSELINKILHTDYVDNAGIDEFEHIRVSLRNLMKYLQKETIKYDTYFTDEILSTEWNESELENDELKNYKAKAEYYVRQHQDNIAIAKLKTNQPLTEVDIDNLEQILWKEVGSKDDYEKEYGHKPLGEFVREIVGLDMNAAKEAFSEFLNDTNLDSRQIYFVNQIVEYIVHNGMMKDLSVLQESPFTDKGSVVEIFTDLTVWMGIRKVIDQINANAAA